MAELLKERGFFWWFNDPDQPAHSKESAVPALLTISEDGQITLDTDGTLSQENEPQNLLNPRIFPETRRIAGLLASKGEYVLLGGLERTDFSLSDESPQQQRFSADVCARRDSPFPETYGHNNFIELRIEMTGFEDWLQLDSIVVDEEYDGTDRVRIRISYKEWKLAYRIPGGTLAIESITTRPLTLFTPKRAMRDAEFKQNYYLVFTPDSPTDVDSLRYRYTALEEFFALLLGTYSPFPAPIFVSKEEFDPWNILYFRGAPSPQPIKRYSIWVFFTRVKDVFGEAVTNWLIRSQSYGAGYYLYVASLRNPHHYQEDRFVNLVWGIEALHRKWLAESDTSERTLKVRGRVEKILSMLPSEGGDRQWLRSKLAHAHEPSLETRILECLRKLPLTFGRGEVERFAKACADRRNDISHAGGPRNDMDYQSFHIQVSRLAEALDHLFHVLLLHQIGIERSAILEIMTNSLVSERIKTALANAGLSIETADQP